MEEKNEGLGNSLGVLLIVVGVYMFLTGLVRRKATNLLTIILSSVAVAFGELFGIFALLGHIGVSREFAEAKPGFMAGMWLCLVVYILMLVEAYREHRSAVRAVVDAVQEEEEQEATMAVVVEQQRTDFAKQLQDRQDQRRREDAQRITDAQQAKENAVKVRFNENNTNWT